MQTEFATRRSEQAARMAKKLNINDFKRVFNFSRHLDKPLFFFDLETCGFQRHSGIVEFAAIIVDAKNSQPIRALHTLVNPQQDIPFVAERVHHISNNMVIHAPHYGKLHTMFQNYFKNAIISGFNTRKYDVPVIYRNAINNGYDGLPETIQFCDVRDIWMSRHADGKGKLFDIGKILSIPDMEVPAHHALSDVYIAIQIMEVMIRDLEIWAPGKSSLESVVGQCSLFGDL